MTVVLVWLSVVDLLVPLHGTAFGGEVEDVPELLDGAVVALILAGIRRGGDHLGGPEVADLVAVAVKDGHERELGAFGRLGVIVALEVIVGGGEQAKVAPTALAGGGEDAVERGFGDNEEVLAGGFEM